MQRGGLKSVLRVGSLVVPSWLAWYVAVSTRNASELEAVVTFTLGPLWATLAGALILRAASMSFGPRRAPLRRILAEIDVLTAAGTALAWFSAAAIIGAVWLGYASLAAVGLLGTAIFHIVTIHALAALRGPDPIRVATISRRFEAGVVDEGAPVVEQLRFDGTRIPIGFRLFVTGRIGPRWATSRHVLEASSSDGEIVIESDVGPAVRGEHDAEPLDVWLEDLFGLCRSPRQSVGTAHLTVLPRIPEVRQPVPLLDRGIGPRAPRITPRLPTEGLFHLRDYQQGDDVRRIHWVRSAATGTLIVRLPDEVPPDRPRVRLVLDTFFPEVFALSSECATPFDMLDTIVGVWLAVARSLVEAGVRVTLVSAVPHDGGVAVRQHEMSVRDHGAALRFGTQIAWQARVMVDELLTDESTYVVSRGFLSNAPPPSERIRWIVVTPGAWAEMPWPTPSVARFPYPIGSSENRWSHRRRVDAAATRQRLEHARALSGMSSNVARAPHGSLVARPSSDDRIQLEALQ